MNVRATSVSETWRVGVLFSRTGLMAVTETEHFLGTALAIQEINQARRRSSAARSRSSPMIRDPNRKPTAAWPTGF